MIRLLFPCAAALAACSNNPSTGHASLMACTAPANMPLTSCTNGTVTGNSAWVETTHIGYMVNGMATNYLGWLVQYTTATPGTECTNDLSAVTTVKIITTQVETATLTRAVLMPEMISVVAQNPNNPPTVDVAVVSTSDATALFTGGIISITSDTTTDKNGNGEIDGSIAASGTYASGNIFLSGDFYAHKCFL